RPGINQYIFFAIAGSLFFLEKLLPFENLPAQFCRNPLPVILAEPLFKRFIVVFFRKPQLLHQFFYPAYFWKWEIQKRDVSTSLIHIELIIIDEKNNLAPAVLVIEHYTGIVCHQAIAGVQN